ncbi:DegT/DnrJ/EryC1/StrS family aminotransferase [Candidatus Pelagibacter sp.]|jgi:aminotransferase EvaB|nr:DegT/DnrJ/EryC1/StrS family aminotransferase [Candidatus Pelagibacter sp.]
MIKFWTYRNEYKLIKKKLHLSLDNVLNSGTLFFGKQLEKFENNFIKINKLAYGTSVKTGTDALIISLMALGIKRGDEVITVANTAIPTISAIKFLQAKIKLVDVGEDYLIDVTKIERLITKKTKVIIPVHLYGQSCEMSKIIDIAKKYKLKIIEDCAQAQGAKYNNKLVGNFGDLSCYSFYPTKILGAYGDGGFIGTKNKKLFEKVKRIRFYGIETENKNNKYYNKYYANENGMNSRLDEIQASILNIKIPRLKNSIKNRQHIASIYNKELSGTRLKLPMVNNKCTHVYHLYVVYHPKRNEIIKQLMKKKIFTNIQYPYPIHKMKAYKNLAYFKKNELKNAEKFSKGIFSLPIYPELSNKKLYKIIKELKYVLNNKNL